MRWLVIFIIILIGVPQVRARLTVQGDVKQQLNLSASDLENFTVAEVQAKDKGGAVHTFRGVSLFSILQAAGVTLGKDLHGENLRKFALVTGSDNYAVVFALTELDPDFTSNVVLLATHVDGKPLPSNEGTYRLVNPADKRPARWVRQVQSIKIISANQ